MMLAEKFVPLLLAGSLALASCGGSSGSDSSGDSSAPSATSTTTVTGSTEPAPAKVSANDASVDEITAALDAVGVANADRWAHEVEEYRPYTDAADGFPKLREELAKYNPAEGTIDQIIAVLSE